MSFTIFQSRVVEMTDSVLRKYVSSCFASALPGQEKLREAMEYSLFSGGKRFRPILACAVAEAVGESIESVLPWAAAVEMIHSYSLVHDDLPCMDNDDFRRGQLTTHKKFGESTALLAGDALLTESFLFLTSALREQPERAALLVALLAQASGVRGMIGGQVTDLLAQKSTLKLGEIEGMHLQKTGALIQVAAQGAAILVDASENQVELASNLGRYLGLAFQIADDLLDYEADAVEPGSYPAVLGVLKTQEHLQTTTAKAMDCARGLGSNSKLLMELIEFNLRREH
jgi:geranylgeranyl diphosphate synthase type II